MHLVLSKYLFCVYYWHLLSMSKTPETRIWSPCEGVGEAAWGPVWNIQKQVEKVLSTLSLFTQNVVVIHDKQEHYTIVV